MDCLYPDPKELFAIHYTSKDDLRKLEEKYLQPADRDLLRTYRKKVEYYTASGCLVGLGLGILVGSRLRFRQTALYNAFRPQEKPIAMMFADGRIGEW